MPFPSGSEKTQREPSPSYKTACVWVLFNTRNTFQLCVHFGAIGEATLFGALPPACFTQAPNLHLCLYFRACDLLFGFLDFLNALVQVCFCGRHLLSQQKRAKSQPDDAHGNPSACFLPPHYALYHRSNQSVRDEDTEQSPRTAPSLA